MEQHKAIIEDGVLEADSTVLAIFPSPMMYAGKQKIRQHMARKCRLYIYDYWRARDWETYTL